MSTPFESGPEDAPICIVGEAPSYREVQEGCPFVGPAGQLLDRLLQAAQIRRSEVRFLNVFETQIKKPRDDQSKIFSENDTLLWTAAKGFTESGREAARGCAERLRTCTANIIVPLGNPALHHCVDVRSISKWRGSIISGNGVAAGRKIVPSIHPSAALKGAYETRYIIAADLKRVKAESSSPEIHLDQRNLLIDPTFDQVIRHLNRALESEVLDTDIELLNGSVDCFSIALSPTEAISIPLVDAHFEHRWSAEEEHQIWLAYARLLAAPHITKINQNIVFDLSILLQLNHLVPQGPLDDPMVAFSVMNPFLGKNLGLISSLYTREPYYKDDGELHDSHDIEDFQRRWLYNAKDAAVALEAMQKLSPELDAKGYRTTYDMTMNLAPSLIWMGVRGLRVNATKLAATKVKTEARMAELERQMAPLFSRPIITEAPKKAAEKRAVAASKAININAPMQIGEYFYGEKGYRPCLRDGRPSVDDLALSTLIRRENDPIARLLQEWRGLKTLNSRYLELKYDRDGRVRCSWNIRGTWPGRLSSSQTVTGGGLNFQNIPEEARGFVESDYANISNI